MFRRSFRIDLYGEPAVRQFKQFRHRTSNVHNHDYSTFFGEFDVAFRFWPATAVSRRFSFNFLSVVSAIAISIQEEQVACNSRDGSTLRYEFVMRRK
jgi:hypothetical protein